MKSYLLLGLLLATSCSSSSDSSELTTTMVRTDLYLCESPVMSSGKQADTYVEIFKDLSRAYHVTLVLDNGIFEKFDAVEKPVETSFTETNVLHGISESIKTSYNLSEDTNYQVKFNGTRVDINVVGDTKPESFAALGIPTAQCARISD